MPATIIEAVFIVLIAISLVAIATPFAVNTIKKTMDLSESNIVKNGLEICNDKLLETARTGVGNRCLFSISRGLLSVNDNWIRYKITSTADLCDQSNFTLLNQDKNIWQGCTVDNDVRTYELGWFSNSTKFEIQGYSGKLLEFSRKDLFPDYALLSMKVS